MDNESTQTQPNEPQPANSEIGIKLETQEDLQRASKAFLYTVDVYNDLKKDIKRLPEFCNYKELDKRWAFTMGVDRVLLLIDAKISGMANTINKAAVELTGNPIIVPKSADNPKPPESEVS